MKRKSQTQSNTFKKNKKKNLNRTKPILQISKENKVKNISNNNNKKTLTIKARHNLNLLLGSLNNISIQEQGKQLHKEYQVNNLF
jgi:hypothetical protein